MSRLVDVIPAFCLLLLSTSAAGFLSPTLVPALALRTASFTNSDPWSLRCAKRSCGSATALSMAADSEDFDDASMEAFRALMSDSWDGKTFDDDEEEKEFDGYQFRDMIVDKWGVPYDVQIKREMFLGKPMIFLNVMWKYLGQQSFYLDEQRMEAQESWAQEYLEHLQAIAELCLKWDKVEHLKQVVAECKKRPNAYFGYAVPLPLNLPAEIMDELNIPESQ